MTDRRFLRRVSLLVLPALLLVSSQPARADDTAIPPEIEKILALPEDKIDIGLAALTFAHEVYPDETDVQAYSTRIDKIVAEVRQLEAEGKAQRLPGLTGGPEDTILALNEVFYNREGFKYDHSPDANRNPANQFLPGTMERKLGICSTMPMLYMAIAQRLGLPVFPVEAPVHTFLRVIEPNLRFRNIETTSGGGPSRDAWYIEQEHISQTALKRGTYMRTITHHQYLAQLLANNGNFWLYRGQKAKALVYYKRALEIDPQSPLPPLDLMDFYVNFTLKAQDDYFFALNDNDRREAAEDFAQAVFYRKQLRDMGINMGDYVHEQKAAETAAPTQ